MPNLIEIAQDILPEVPSDLHDLLAQNQEILDRYPLQVQSDIARVVQRIHKSEEEVLSLGISKESFQEGKKQIINSLKSPELYTWESRDKCIEIGKEFLSKYFGFDFENLPDPESKQFQKIKFDIKKISNWKKLLKDLSLYTVIENCIGKKGARKGRCYFQDLPEFINECIGYFLEYGDLGLKWDTKEKCLRNGIVLFGRHFNFSPENLPKKDSKEFLKIQERIKNTTGWIRLLLQLNGLGINRAVKTGLYKNKKEWIFECLQYFLGSEDDISMQTKEELNDLSSKDKCTAQGKIRFGKHFGFDPGNPPQKDSDEFSRIQKEIFKITRWQDLSKAVGLTTIIGTRIGSSKNNKRIYFYETISGWLYDCLNHFVESKKKFEQNQLSWELPSDRVKNSRKAINGLGFDFKKSEKDLEKISSIKAWHKTINSLKISSLRNYIGIDGKKRKSSYTYTNIAHALSDIFELPEYYFQPFGRHLIREYLKSKPSSAEQSIDIFSNIPKHQYKAKIESVFHSKISKYNDIFREEIVNEIEKKIINIQKHKNNDPLFERYQFDFFLKRAERKVFMDNLYKKETTFIDEYRKHSPKNYQEEDNTYLKEELTEKLFSVLQEKDPRFQKHLDAFLKGKIDISDPFIQELIQEAKQRIEFD